MDNKQLKKIISKLPSQPGIYLFKGRGGNNIYIGKAASLKTRVLNYLKTEDVRIRKMLETAQKLEFKTTDSDIEALILESQHIKQHRPMFNIVMRDDKQYFYVGFTKERFPRIFLTHQHLKPKVAFIGPFTDGGALKATLRYLRSIFPYCTCKQEHNNYCLNYHIEKCLGFCCIKKTESRIKNYELREYKNNIRSIKNILSGKRGSLIKKLEKEMLAKAKSEDFEGAIKIRARLERLQKVFENAQIVRQYYDISKNHNKNLLEIKKALGLKALPKRIECYDISNIHGSHATGSVVVFENGKPAKNEYRKFKIKTIKQASLPRRQAGDTDMLKEVLTRRFNHPEWPHPDLIIIDGGKGQLNAARSIINDQLSMINKIPVIALTKNSRHRGEKLTLANKKSVNLSALPEKVKNLILAIDSEAHRFAINYYRKLHRRAIL